jgi:hypothetical protein
MDSWFERPTDVQAPKPFVFETAEPRRPIGFGREDESKGPRIVVVRGLTAQDLDDWRRQRERPAR